jgi:hypothetical protein
MAGGARAKRSLRNLGGIFLPCARLGYLNFVDKLEARRDNFNKYLPLSRLGSAM